MVVMGNNVHKSLSNTVTYVGDSLFPLGFFNGRTEKKCHCEGEMCQTITPPKANIFLCDEIRMSAFDTIFKSNQTDLEEELTR